MYSKKNGAIKIIYKELCISFVIYTLQYDGRYIQRQIKGALFSSETLLFTFQAICKFKKSLFLEFGSTWEYDWCSMFLYYLVVPSSSFVRFINPCMYLQRFEKKNTFSTLRSGQVEGKVIERVANSYLHLLLSLEIKITLLSLNAENQLLSAAAPHSRECSPQLHCCRNLKTDNFLCNEKQHNAHFPQ